MKFPESLAILDKEYKAILREELVWLYDKLNLFEQDKLEQKLTRINRIYVNMLTNTVVKKQISRELQSFDEMINLFKMSRN